MLSAISEIVTTGVVREGMMSRRGIIDVYRRPSAVSRAVAEVHYTVTGIQRGRPSTGQ
jgi:hypothetical protein